MTWPYSLRSQRGVRLLLALALLGAGTLRSTRLDASTSSCRQSCIALNVAWAKVCNAISARDTSGNQGNGYCQAGYSLMNGTSHVNTWGPDVTEVDATDSYMLVGADPGFPIPVLAHMNVGVSVQAQCRPYPQIGCSGGSVAAYFSDSLNAPQTHSTSSSGSFQLTLPLNEPIGRPFTLLWNAQASSGNWDLLVGSADGAITITFDLPPGVGVVSCGGYSSGMVTSAQRQTWGAVKSHYR